MADYGKIIVLNGPSSAGKTTLSRNLQKIWDRPLYYLSYDSVDWYMAPFGVTPTRSCSKTKSANCR